MKYTYIITVFLCMSLLTLSCNSFLDEDPKGQLNRNNFFNSQAELDMSVYSIFRFAAEAHWYTSMMDAQWMGDDITTDAGSNKQSPREFDSFDVSDNNIGASETWNRFYKIIKAANFVILNAEKTPTTPEEIKIAVGQAKFWRAYSYFVLVRIFGELPMNLDNEIDYNKPLVSIGEVYDQIISDLKDAENLPADYSDAPRKTNGVNAYITTQAVKSTLAAVYMAMAGYPLKKNEYYAQAAQKAKEVIDGVNAGIYDFDLEPEFKHIYASSHNYSKETVVGILRTYTFGQDSQLTLTNVFMSLPGGWGDAWGEIKFWKEMPAGPRKDAIYNPKILLVNEGNKLVNWWDLRENGTPYIPEYHPMFSIFTMGEGNTDYDYTKDYDKNYTNNHTDRLVRYSEVLLWYAEAQARAEGAPNALAYECINRVRARAGLEELEKGLSGKEFADAALREHGWEVAGYYIAMVTRRADLLRTELLRKTFEERAKNSPIEVAPGIFAREKVEISNTTWNEKRIYAPRPSGDVSLNPHIQNK